MVQRIMVGLGVLAGTTLSNFISSQLARGSDMTLGGWILSAVVPIGMLVIYWLWLEPQHNNARVRATRYQKAFEGTADRAYKLDPKHNISRYGLLFEGASDPFRKGWYGEFAIGDLFKPDPSKGEKLLGGKADELVQLLGRVESEGFTFAVLDALKDWERSAADDVEFYQRGRLGKGQAAQFTKRSFANEKDDAARLRRLNQELREIRLYAKDQGRLAKRRAERLDGS